MNADIHLFLAHLDKHPGSLMFARLAEACLQTDKITEAIDVCEQGLAHHPGYVNGHLVMGKCYARIGLREQAIREFQRTLEGDPEHVAALLNLGDIFDEEKRDHEALHYYQCALEADPLNSTIQKRIASLKGQRSLPDPDQGEALRIDSTEAPGDEMIATATLAGIYASQGLTAKALDMYRRLQARSPQRSDITMNIQELEEQLRNEEQGGTNGDNG